MRWLTIRRSTITSASAKPASRSPPPSDHSWTLFVPTSSWTSDLVLQGRLGVDDDRQRLVLDDDVLGGVDDGVAVVADDRRRPASPTWLTLPLASGQCSGVLTSTPGGTHAIGSGPPEVHVLAGVDGDDVVARLGRGRVDRRDARVRLGRADEGDVERRRAA